MTLALPIQVPEPDELEEDARQSIIRRDSEHLTRLLVDYDKFRDYYDGDQSLTYATDEWKLAFGDQFEELVANWCEVVVDVLEERIELDRIIFRSSGDEEDEDLSDRIWQVLHDNEFGDLENDLYNGALVEGVSSVIVWPDENIGARVDQQSAQNVLVRYDDNDERVINHAIKRWVTDDGELRLTLYTPDFIYKYKIPSTVQSEIPDEGTLKSIEDQSHSLWEPRPISETGDTAWPLPNPFGEVPIVEFKGRRDKSELTNITPIQDAFNKTLADVMVSGEYNSYRQKYIVSSNEEPQGGWKSTPGNVWTLVPEVDIEGKPLPTQIGTLDETPPDGYIKVLEMLLQVVSTISRTPTYYFMQSSRQGSRGDAPSGDALRVTETGLIKKVQKLQGKWATAWVKVGRLVAMASRNSGAIDLVGDVSWKNPQAHFMTQLLEEARRMIQELGLPPEFAWRHIGLTEKQIRDARTWREENLPEGRVVTRIDIQNQPPASTPPQRPEPSQPPPQ